jgi:hypothetical protein
MHTSKTTAALNKEEDISVNKIQFMYFNFLLYVSGLLPPRNATPFVRLLHKVYLTGISSVQIINILGQLIAVYVYWGNIPLIASTMSTTSEMILTGISCAYFLHSKNKFMRHVDLLRMEFVAKTKSKYIRFVQTAERQVKMGVFAGIPLTVIFTSLWIIGPFLNKYTISNFENNNVTTGGNVVEEMIFVTWVPFGIEESPQFEIIFVLQFVGLAVPILMLFAVDSLFVSLMSHATAQFKVLCAMLNDMHENVSESEPYRTKSASPLHVSTDDSSVKEAVTSAHDNIPHQYRSGIEEHSGSLSSETARPEYGHVDEDPFRLYLVECIKYHQAIIE